MGRIIGVVNTGLPVNSLLVVIQDDFHVVIDPLLPIIWAGGAGSNSFGGWRGKTLRQLSEFILAVVAVGLAFGGKNHTNGNGYPTEDNSIPTHSILPQFCWALGRHTERRVIGQGLSGSLPLKMERNFKKTLLERYFSGEF